MSAITTHVLDISRGRPAEGVPIQLEMQEADGGWRILCAGVTDRDGRLKELLPASHVLEEGIYRLTFDTRSYFVSQHTESFYPEVKIVFAIRDASEHYHVPLLLSPFGYSTYRGS